MRTGMLSKEYVEECCACSRADVSIVPFHVVC